MTTYRFGRSLKPLRHPLFWCAMWCLAIAAVVCFSLVSSPPMPDFAGSDKVSHFLAYFVLASCAVQLFRNWAGLLGTGIALVLLGIALEYAQDALTEYRMIDPRDALANMLGVIAGLSTRLTPLRDLLLRLDGGARQSS